MVAFFSLHSRMAGLREQTVCCYSSVASEALFVALIKRGISRGLGYLTVISGNPTEDTAPDNSHFRTLHTYFISQSVICHNCVSQNKHYIIFYLHLNRYKKICNVHLIIVEAVAVLDQFS